MSERVQKALSERGFCSRRAAEKLMVEGRVAVNGRTVSPGDQLEEGDVLTVDGSEVVRASDKPLYYALYKPRGYVTTMSDEQGRRCVQDLMKGVPARVYPVGRLDLTSEGLLIMTSDGELANAMMRPSTHIGKLYRVTVRPQALPAQIEKLQNGVELDDGYVTRPAKVDVKATEPGRTVMEITIFEGKNRQIRRMCEAVGLEVARLKRSAEGPIKLGMQKPGECRQLTEAEVRALKRAAGIE